jgi:hypothetical protein
MFVYVLPAFGLDNTLMKGDITNEMKSLIERSKGSLNVDNPGVAIYFIFFCRIMELATVTLNYVRYIPAI